MFLTKDDLKLSYGVHLQIGKTLVERPVPADNLYWKNRTTYVPGAPGYIFIPIFADILHRSGVHLDELLSENFIQSSEKILHNAALHEHEQITWKEHIFQVAELVRPNMSNAHFFGDLLKYAAQERPIRIGSLPFGTAFPSLNRADAYLFLLSIIKSPSFDMGKALKAWYALMTYFLLMDDLADIKEDVKTGQPNALIDAGLHDDGEQLIAAMIDKSIVDMAEVNPVLANRIDHKKSLIDLHGLIASIRLGN
ncbi:MAG: hypothetical protein LW706_11460 [Chitinophagaceae bacterium]|nr:hypothetical protein [Chitinophagaceae bacterium]